MEQIDRYQIQSVLGQGATAIVYKAFDPEISRVIAIKVLMPALARNEDYRTRFIREAKGAGTLSHPNIVTVYDVGEHEGLPYIVMEYIEGQSLAQVLEETPRLPLAEVIGIGYQLSQALGFAHKKGIVHRDIKPANIMMLRDSKTIKVTDFGICRFEDRELTQATRVGDVIGTPQYMSPEQVMGHPADSRSDVFSTGIVLYQMLTGEVPFAGKTAVSVQMQIAKAEPKPLQQIVPDLPASARRAVERALMKEPNRRYRNGEELARVLAGVQRELDEIASARERNRRIPIGVRWAAIMGLLIAVTMAVTITFVAIRQRAELLNQVMDYGGSLTKFMASQSAEPVLGERWVDVEVFVETAVAGQDFAYLIVVDRQETVRGTSLAAQLNTQYRPPAGDRVDGAPAGLTVVRTTSADGRDVLDFAAPIRYSRTELGTVHLGIFETPLQRVVQVTLGLLGILMLVTVAAAAAGSFVLARRLIKPMHTLRTGLREIAGGRYDFRIAEKRSDELGELYNEFDAMALALQARHEAPKDLATTDQTDLDKTQVER